MPKGGSGFRSGAAGAAKALQKGASREWRLTNPGDYTKEITDLFKSMYRTGVVAIRNSRGQLKDWGGSDVAFERAMDRVNNLAKRMAQNVEVYDRGAAETYRGLLRTWGKPVYVNSREMAEFRNGMQYGDKMLVNPRGRYGVHSDAANRAAERGYVGGNNNVDILLHANRALNATQSSIWQNASKSGATEHYAGHIADQLWTRYEKTERAAWRRRKK